MAPLVVIYDMYDPVLYVYHTYLCSHSSPFPSFFFWPLLSLSQNYTGVIIYIHSYVYIYITFMGSFFFSKFFFQRKRECVEGGKERGDSIVTNN